jgi:uncharacterized protein (TIGR02271 family)
MKYRMDLMVGALAGAFLLWLSDRVLDWGNPAGALVTGVVAGIGTAAGWRLLPLLTDRKLPRSDEAASAKIMLREERLHITKERVETAHVDVHRERVEEYRTYRIPVYREELVVERDGEEACRIPVREEQVEFRKVAVPLNEVDIRTEKMEDMETIEENLRKEVARITVSGLADVTENEQHSEGP